MSELYDLLHSIPKRVAEGAVPAASASDTSARDERDTAMLFEPVALRETALKNRIVLDRVPVAAIPSDDGNPTEALLAFYAERAAGGTGLILTEAVIVDRQRKREEETPTEELRLNDDEAAGKIWRDLLERCHEHDCKVFLTLSAGAGRQGDPDAWSKRRRGPISASRNVMSRDPKQKTWRMPDFCVRRLIRSFGETAKRAAELGFDGIHIAADRGNLLAQFSDPMFNRRLFGRYKDCGNTVEAILRAVREAVGDKLPISLACDVDNGWRHCYTAEDFDDARKRYFKREEEPAAPIERLKRWHAAGADVILPQFGSAETRWWYSPDTGCPDAMYADYFRVLQGEIPAIPLILSGKVPDAAAAAALPLNAIDLIAPTAALIADAEWPVKVAAGEGGARPAIYSLRPDTAPAEVSEETSDTVAKRVFCTVNPRAGSEWLLPAPTATARTPKRVAVIGSGPAGVECALTALERGHYVWLFDLQREVGGFLNLVDKAPYHRDLRRYVNYMRERVDAEMLNGKFRYHSWTVATMAMLEEHELDTIVLADGATEVMPNFAGADSAVTYAEFLADPAAVTADKQRVAVAGSDDRLIDAAFRLKYELGKDPIIIFTADRDEPLPLCRAMSRAHCLMRDRVPVYGNAVIERYEDGKVFMSAYRPLNPAATFREWITAGTIEKNPVREAQIEDCDGLIYAAPEAPRAVLRDLLQQYAIAPEITRVGGESGHVSVEDAVLNGYRAGIMI